ncbi:MAG: hypothetical protein KAX10_08895 [Candidatus Lokiarchaeota archaeon]|nr:hypothetical protein [Candidatus Lokiarchaeota archaeon]
MEKIDDLYKINRERFLDNYRVTENILKSTEKNKVKIIAQWLVDNQSVGPSQESNVEIINYYSKYLKKDKTLLDFALEWIRAQKIRSRYMLHLIKTHFPSNNSNLVIDYFISSFFLKYNKILRDIFKDTIQEYELSALLDIIFASEREQNFIFENHMEKHKNNPQCPTLFKGSERIDTSILTLRSGLASIIKRDYESRVQIPP